MNRAPTIQRETSERIEAIAQQYGLDPGIIKPEDMPMLENLSNARWRLNNLYYIRDKEGQTVRYRPWPEQAKFYDNIWYRNIVPKARQRGFSTAIQLMAFDACIFVPNTASAIIAQDRDTAGKIFNDKIKFAWERVPDLIHEINPLTTDTKTEMGWDSGSSIVVSTSTRGNTLQYLHVSELGIIAQKFPEKAREIQTGSLPSVDVNGIVVIESTVESPYGIFSEMVRQAEKHQQTGKELSKLDYKLHFASWWDADEYEEDPKYVTISPTDHAYFERMEGNIGRPIGIRKRAWYVAKRDNDFAGEDEKMWSQYPTTLEEAFQVASEGKWLATQMAQARGQGRIGDLPYDPRMPVDTWWDLGLGDDTAIWFAQRMGPWIHWINFIEGAGEPYSYYVKKMEKFGYVWGTHYLPHDGKHRRPDAEVLKTSADMLEELGLRRIEIVPRINELTVGIGQMRDAFPRYKFDQTNCAEGIEHLDKYQKTWNERLGTWTSEPLKNGHDHAADAIRQHGQMAHISDGDGGPRRPKRRNKSGMAA